MNQTAKRAASVRGHGQISHFSCTEGREHIVDRNRPFGRTANTDADTIKRHTA